MFSLCEANINYHKFHINTALILVSLRTENFVSLVHSAFKNNLCDFASLRSPNPISLLKKCNIILISANSCKPILNLALKTRKYSRL